MTHEDHLALLREGVRPGARFWADLGSGTGSFTLALAELLGGEGRILSVDRDEEALAEQERALRTRFPRLEIQLRAGDFTTLTGVAGLDGILMANSLHFQRDGGSVVKKAWSWLKPGGSLIVVEYEILLPNPWVPHPVPYRRFVRISEEAGFAVTRLLAVRPSRYHGKVYAGMAEKKP